MTDPRKIENSNYRLRIGPSFWGNAKQRRAYRRILNRFVKPALSAQAARTEVGRG